MISSMTGYGRGCTTVGERELQVEIRSVNQRGFEFSARMPRSLLPLEERIKKQVAERVARGKIEVSVQLSGDAQTRIDIHPDAAAVYVDAVRSLAGELGLPDDLSASHLLRIDGLFTVTREAEDLEAVAEALTAALSEALDAFCEMRQREGERLAADMLEKLDGIEAGVEKVMARSPETIAAYRERLFAKLREVLADTNIDEGRVLTEAAIYADRVAVDEETVRLKSHLSQFRSLLEALKSGLLHLVALKLVASS